MTVIEKVAYLKGLAEGLKLDENVKSEKLISAIIDTLEEIVHSIDEMADDVVDITEQLDAVDEDLADLEEYVFEDLEDDEDEDEEFYQVVCPECDTEVYLDEDMLCDGEVNCPNCGTTLELDFDECDCDCEECSAEE